MQLGIFAIGRMKSGPERDLVARYCGRLDKAAPALGLSFAGITEKPESRAGDTGQRKRDEAALLAQHCDAIPGTMLVLLDETGRNLASPALADMIGSRRDGGARRMVFAVGGPDGFDPALRARADLTLAFGAATWPHQIVRILLAEQLYRATTILSGHPYHRA